MCVCVCDGRILALASGKVRATLSIRGAMDVDSTHKIYIYAYTYKTHSKNNQTSKTNTYNCVDLMFVEFFLLSLYFV